MKHFFTFLFSCLVVTNFTFAQNVGVDVSSPVQKLDVAGGIKIGFTNNAVQGSIRMNGTELEYHNGTNWVSVGNVSFITELIDGPLNDNDTWIRVATDAGLDNDIIRMTTSGVERLRVLTDGRVIMFEDVGIGTDSPERNLHVVDAAGGSVLVSRGDANTNTGETLGEIQFDSEDNTNPSAVGASAAIRGIAAEEQGNSNKGGHMAFLTKPSGGGTGAVPGAERLRITDDGNVGVGTPLPTQLLDVDGQIRMRPGASSGFVPVSSGDGTMTWTDPTLVGADITTASNGLTEVANDIQLGGDLTQTTTVTQGNNGMVFDLTGTGDFEVRDNGDAALFVKEDGSIGINTNSPDASAILDIVSKAKGMLIPRMSFTERNAIVSPANSLIIFNLTSGCLEIFADGAWQSFYCSCPVLDPLQPILGPDPVCSGTTVNYSVPGVTGTATYEWTIDGVLTGNITGQGGTAISFSAPSLNTYDVTVVASNACLTSTSTQTMLGVNAYTNVPALSVWASTPTAICEGESYGYSVVDELGPNGLSAIDYTWTVTVTGSVSATLTANSQVATAGNPAVFTGASTAITVDLADAGAGNVSVSVTANNTCGSSSVLSENLAVNLLSVNPTSATASTNTICNGQSTTLTLNGGGGGTNQVIEWYTGGCGSTPAGTGNNLSVSPTATTTYYGRYETPSPCSDETTCQAVTITVNQPSVAPTSITGATAGCNGDPLVLTAIGGTLGTGANYQWGTGAVGSNILAGQTANTLTTAPVVTTTYWVRIVNTTSPCTAATAGVTTTLTINQPSVAPTGITGTTPLCNGDNTTLTAVGGTLGTGANYQWGTGAVVGSNILAGQTASTLAISPTGTTIYWVRIVNTSSPCVATTAGVTLNITVNQPSVAPTSIGTGGIVCLGTPQTLTAVGGTLGTGANYQWGTGTTVGSNIIVGETNVTMSVSPTVTTSYWVRIVNTIAPCAATTAGVTTSLSINQPSVAPTNITGTTPLCNGDNTILNAIGGTLGTGANYQWGTGAVVGSSILAGQTAATLAISPTSTTIYWVRIVNTASPCVTNTAGVTLTITVNQPSVAPTSITGVTTVCNGSGTTLTTNGATLGTGANYQWGTGSVIGTNPIVGQTNITLTVSPTTNTTYWVRVENGTAPCGANTGGVSQLISVNDPSVAPTSINATNTTLCNGDPVTLTAIGGTLGSGANYQWGTGATVGTSPIVGATSATYTPSPNPIATTTYWVRIENTDSPCTANTGGVTQLITVNQPSVAPTTITAGTNPICNGATVTLSANGTLGSGANYQWGTGTTIGSGVIGGATSQTYDATPTANTTYWVRIVNGLAPCTPTTGGTTLAVTVDNFTAAAAGSDQSVCSTSATMAANAPTTGNGAWSVQSGAGSFSPSTSPTATVSGLGTGANTLRWTLANGACADDFDDVVITSSPALPAPTSVTATPSSIVTGQSSNLNATSAGNLIGWYTSASGGAPLGTSASGANFSVSPTTTTTYYAESQPQSSIDFSETFYAGVTPVAQAIAWCNFRSQLLASYSYTSLTVSSNYGSTTISDPAAILQIANALRTSSNTTVNVGGNTWNVTTGCVAGSSPCGGTATVLHMNQVSCNCGSGMFVLRPEINNSNWGGVGSSHCGGPTQTINVSFEYNPNSCTSTTRTPVTVTVNAPTLPPQCYSYSELSEQNRSTSQFGGNYYCDVNVITSGYYRVTRPGYNQIADNPIGPYRCG
ncbi:hypothetical protein OAE48_03190, partial [Flavobacteriales bacterium]|nr:hypothetical protein [Flavobacteriales bacterium]